MTSTWSEKSYEAILPECPICYNPIYSSEKATLKCGHVIHKSCLAKWAGDPKRNPMDINKRCPICRGPLELKVEKGMIRRENTNTDELAVEREKQESKRNRNRNR